MILIPDKVSGRKVTRRGVHLHPSGNHGDWLKQVELWIERLVAMHMSWVVVCTDDGAALPGDGGQVDSYGRSAVEALLDAGIIPILRFQPSNLTKPFTPFEWVRAFKELCDSYGVPAFVQLANEHGDAREWHNGSVPWDHFSQYARWFMKTASDCIWPYGVVAITADEPFHSQNPFKWYDDGTLAAFVDGAAVFGWHGYAHNTPFNHPYVDAVTKGTPMTQAEYDTWLGSSATFPGFQEPSLEHINAQRLEYIDPNPKFMDYSVCWNAWSRLEFWMLETFGQVLPMAMTEGGWTPGAMLDDRYPKMSHTEVAKNTLLMYEDEEAPFFAICPWLLADALMCGGSAVGWEGDSWFSSAYRGIYPDDVMPVVQTLIDNPPGSVEPLGGWEKIRGIVTDVRGLVDASL